jgi:N-acyl-D-aspartate/D-glutamate deacylase
MLFLMRRYDKGFRYWADVSNVGNRMTLDYLLLHPQALPGFNDSGAHITNMAFLRWQPDVPEAGAAAR